MGMTQLKQVVGYVPEPLKAEISEMKAAHRRLTESALVEEAFLIAMPELRKRYLTFRGPAQEAPGKKHKIKAV